MPPEERKSRKAYVNRLSTNRKLKREKVIDHNKNCKILFLERQVKYLDAILKVLQNEDRKSEQIVAIEYEVLKSILYTPKYQIPDPLDETDGRKKNRIRINETTDPESSN
jgi:hypothetical protein